MRLENLIFLDFNLYFEHCSAIGQTSLKCARCCLNSCYLQIVVTPSSALLLIGRLYVDQQQRLTFQLLHAEWLIVTGRVPEARSWLEPSLQGQSLEASILAARCDKSEGNLLLH